MTAVLHHSSLMLNLQLRVVRPVLRNQETPKGFRPKAQGCRVKRGYPGSQVLVHATSTRLRRLVLIPNGMAQPRCGWKNIRTLPRVGACFARANPRLCYETPLGFPDKFKRVFREINHECFIRFAGSRTAFIGSNKP